jgi:hypothetical protein
MAEVTTPQLNGIPHADVDTRTNGKAHANDHADTNGASKEAFVDGNVAISANTPELVPGLVEQVACLGKIASLQDHKERSALLDAARSLVYALETPREAMIRHCWSQVSCLSFEYCHFFFFQRLLILTS